jgi:hypothetical protein
MKNQFRFGSEDPTFNLELFKQNPDKWLLFNRRGEQVHFIGVNSLADINDEKSDSYYYAVHFSNGCMNSDSTSINGRYRGYKGLDPDGLDVFMISTDTVYVHITKEIQNSFLSSQIEEDESVIYIQQFTDLGNKLSSTLIKS